MLIQHLWIYTKTGQSNVRAFLLTCRSKNPDTYYIYIDPAKIDSPQCPTTADLIPAGTFIPLIFLFRKTPRNKQPCGGYPIKDGALDLWIWGTLIQRPRKCKNWRLILYTNLMCFFYGIRFFLDRKMFGLVFDRLHNINGQTPKSL